MSVFTVMMKMHFLQQWRLVHALSEAEQPISLAPEYEAGVRHLQKYFKADIKLEVGKEIPPGLFEIETLGPSTRVGELQRPLVVPHEIVNYCRSLWLEPRDVEYSFIGLNHWGRQRTISEWHQRSFGDLLQSYQVSGSQSIADRVDPLVESGEAAPRAIVLFSKRGRAYPGKVWDDDFYRQLARTRFSLCPDGDQIWSYRFFESMLCGSIPIIQTRWPTYEGFRYFTFDDPVETLVYRQEDLDHNFELCRQRLTLPKQDLDRVLSAALM